MSTILTKAEQKIPNTIRAAGGCYFMANICILILHLDIALAMTVYTLIFFGLYFCTFKTNGLSRGLIAFLIIVTLFWNLFDLNSLALPLHQIISGSEQKISALFGTIFSFAALYFLYCKRARKWFSEFGFTQRHGRLESQIKKTKKYSEKEYQDFLEIQKNIPSSYRWGKWVVLLAFLIGFMNISTITTMGPAHTLWLYIGLILLLIGCIGLMCLFPRLIDFYVTCLYLKIFGVAIVLSILLIMDIIHFGIGDLPKVLYELIRGVNASIGGGHLNHNPNLVGQAAGRFVGAMVLPVVIFYIFLNKQSRLWLKAKRICRGMKTAEEN